MTIETDDTNTESQINGEQLSTDQGTNGEVVGNGGEATGTPPPAEPPKLSEEEQQAAAVDAFKAAAKGVKDQDSAAPKKETPDAAAEAGANGKQPAAKKPDAGVAADKSGVEAKKQPDAEVEKEIAGLALKGKAAERFRDMAGEIKSARPLMDILGKVNVKDANQLDSMLKDVAVGLGYEKMIMDAGAQPEQLKGAMQIIAAMNTGKPELQIQAAQMMLNEAKTVLERHGVNIDGITADPLEKHPDLKQAVEAMDITREHALELARLRTGNVNRNASDTANAQAAERQRQEQAAETQARQQIDVLSNTLKQNDPHFDAKFQKLSENGTFAAISRLPWNQRYQAVLNAYNALPAPVAAPVPAPGQAARVRPTAIQNRGNNVNAGGLARTEFKSDLDAFRAGVDSVSHHG